MTTKTGSTPVDLDDIPCFTHMYELYDPFTLMLFHRSKPLLLDAGHGPTPKLTELSAHAPPLSCVAEIPKTSLPFASACTFLSFPNILLRLLLCRKKENKKLVLPR